MATGRLGAADLLAAADTTIYTCPEDIFSVVTVNICNRGSTATTVSIAVSENDNPTSAEFIEFGTSLLANGVLERTGIVLSVDQRIVVNSNSADVSVVCYGIETQTV